MKLRWGRGKDSWVVSTGNHAFAGQWKARVSKLPFTTGASRRRIIQPWKVHPRGSVNRPSRVLSGFLGKNPTVALCEICGTRWRV